MKTTFAMLGFLLAVGCNDGGWGVAGDTDGVGNPDGDGSDAAPWEEGSDGSDIWDLVWKEDRCEGFDGTPVAGATSFFAGDFRVDQETGDAEGLEYWLLKANDRWQELDEEDCKVVWVVKAEVAEGSCNACDFDLIVEGTMNDALSNCPNGLQDLEAEWSERYAIIQLPDGSLIWHFVREDGDVAEFADGFWDGTRFVFVTEPTCMFF